MIFMEIQRETRKLDTKNTLTEYHRKRFGSKFEIPLLILTNQNKALFLILSNQNISTVHQNKVKRVLRTAARLNIFSNIPLINNKFGINIDEHMKKYS